MRYCSHATKPIGSAVSSPTKPPAPADETNELTSPSQTQSFDNIGFGKDQVATYKQHHEINNKGVLFLQKKKS